MTTITTRITRSTAIALVALVTAAGLGACGSSVDDKATSRTKTTTTVAPSTTSAPTTSVEGIAQEGTGSQTDPGAGNQHSTGNAGKASNPGNTGYTGGGSGTPAGGTAPKILEFTTPDDINCHNGNFQQFTARWRTEGATKVTISIDGPGEYDTYGPNGEADLPFSCSTPHTFLLTAYAANGQTATKLVTLQPRDVVPADPDDQTAQD